MLPCDGSRQNCVASINLRPTQMNRRSFVACFGLASLGACASKAPKPPLKPNDLRSIGMLPIKEWPDSGMAQFNQAMNTAAAFGSAPPPISPTMLGAAIGNAIRASRDADRMALAGAIGTIHMQPEPILRRAMQGEFERRSAEIRMLEDAALAHRVRDNILKDLPTSVDAILDVQIHSAGYYLIGKGKGFSPYLQVTARLLDTVNPGEVIEEFSYGGDHSKSDGDSRYFTTPPELTQPDIVAFYNNAASLRTGLTTVVELIASKLADDIVRVRDKQPRLN